MKKNVFIAGVSLASACAAIALGAVVSANAMASPEPTDEVTVGVIGVGIGSADAIECTFDDLTLPALGAEVTTGPGAIASTGAVPLGELPEGVVPAGGAGELGELGELEGEISVGQGEISVVEGELPELSADAVIISADDARPGTADECAAMREQLELIAP